MPAASEEQKSQSVTAMNEMLGLLGLDARVKDAPDSDPPTLLLETPDPGRIIGRKGQYLQSLELILNRILRKQVGVCPWMELEVDGYKKKERAPRERETPVDGERLEKMAMDAAKEVCRWGETRTLGPLSAPERRVVHMTLKTIEEVQTESSEPDSRGRKKVIVRPAG